MHLPFGKFEKLWAAGSCDAFFLLFFIFLANVGCIFTFSVFNKVKLSHLMFMHNISNRMGPVNGKHLGCCLFSFVCCSNFLLFRCMLRLFFTFS